MSGQPLSTDEVVINLAVKVAELEERIRQLEDQMRLPKRATKEPSA